MDAKSKQYRDGMVEDFLSRRNCLRQRFDDEKVGVANLQFKAAKLFKPITTTQQQQTVKQASEQNKLSDALQRLPAQIIDETNYNPIAALFSGEETRAQRLHQHLQPPLNHSYCHQLHIHLHPVQL